MKLSLGDYGSFVDQIIHMSEQGKSGYICVANVHMFVETYNSPDFAEIVNGADLVTPDGKPLTWGLRWLHGLRQDRVAGMDLLPDLLADAALKGIPVGFYGGTEDMLTRTKRFLSDAYPDLHLAVAFSPPFRSLSEQEERDIIDMLNNSGVRILFVALGCPKQERWMASVKGRLNAVMVGIGGALPVMIGMQKRAPAWMQRSGLEWLFRLVQEPKRLFKRYAYTNTMYMYLITREKLFPRFRSSFRTN